MAVGADSQDLQIDPAALLDALLVPFAKGAIVGRGSGWNMNVLRRDVDVAEKMFVHEVVVGLGVRDVQADIFVEVEGGDVGKIQFTFFVEAYQLLVEAEGSRAGG